MPLTRKTRRVLQSDAVEVPLADENLSSQPPPPPLASAWDSSLPQADPPLKRFKLPDAILQRIGQSTGGASVDDADADADADAAAANDEVINAIRARRLAPRPVLSSQRMPRFRVKPHSHFANSNDDVIRFDDVRKAAAEENDDSSWTDGSSVSGNGNGGDAAAKARKRRGEIDLHFEGFDTDELEESASSSLDEDSNGEEHVDDEEEEEAEDDEEYMEESESQEEYEEENETPTLHTSSGASEGRKGFGLMERRRLERDGPHEPNHSKQYQTRQEEAQQQQQQQRHPHRQQGEEECVPEHTEGRRHRYGGMYFETHIGSAGLESCHHTLLCLNGPVTVQGPCALVGFGLGEVTVGGFFLGRKQLVLLSEQQRVVMTPVRRLKLKNAMLDTPPTPHRLAHTEGEPVSLLPPQLATGEEGEAGNAAWAEDIEGIFGGIDWDWVEAKVASWRGRYASKVPSVVLVVQPCDPAPTRRHYFKRHKNISRKKASRAMEESDTYMDIPRFVARRHEPGIDAALLPEVVPAVLKQSNGAVVVLGSQGIGKSTLARFLTNGFLSLYGVCYWLDLDLGQPEFTPPGVLSLNCVRRPLLHPRDTSCVETVCSYYLGGPRLRCPVATAVAIEQLCAVVERIQRRHPVVINTHGWVLSTGRRMSVEVIRRLQPRHIIHLVKERENRWARDGAALMDPTLGLNSETLHRRFIVQPEKEQKNMGRLPHPFRESSTGHSLSTGADVSAWSGIVHTVQVVRDEKSSRKGNVPLKPSVVRRNMWQQHLAPLFHFYEHRRLREMARKNTGNGQKENKHGDTVPEEVEEEKTSVLEGALNKFHRIVVADAASSKDITESVVCAALEHSVVAVSVQCATAGETETGLRYSSLSDAQCGFPVSFFGFVESTEGEMRETGNIRIRVPLSRDAVRRMWTGTLPDRCGVRVSIACTLMERMDTTALENYF